VVVVAQPAGRPEAEDAMQTNPSSIERLMSGKYTKATGDSATDKPAWVDPKTGGDRIDLSPLPVQIAALESILAEPRFDRARVEAIKQAIVDGRLTIDAEVVADRMIAHALAMRSSSK
jgi:negative regulator of flagellin synthesis FlgM